MLQMQRSSTEGRTDWIDAKICSNDVKIQRDVTLKIQPMNDSWKTAQLHFL